MSSQGNRIYFTLNDLTPQCQQQQQQQQQQLSQQH